MLVFDCLCFGCLLLMVLFCLVMFVGNLLFFGFVLLRIVSDLFGGFVWWVCLYVAFVL